MVRIDKQAEIEKRLGEVKDEVSTEMRRRSRRRPWLTCSLLALCALVAACVWIAWTVAATGLLHVPVFTSLAYEPPAPIREVTPGVPVATVLRETFTSTLTRRLYQGGGNLIDRSIEVHVSEASLTASLRTFLEEANFEWIDVSQAQIVVEPEAGMEVFIPFSSDFSPLHSAITLQGDLSVTQEGHLVVTPAQVVVGRARIPQVLIGLFINPFLEAELARLNTVMVGYAKIFTIEMFSRELLVTGEFSVEVR